MAALDARTRTALLLNLVDGYTQAEIATMLSRPGGHGRKLDLARAGDASAGPSNDA